MTQAPCLIQAAVQRRRVRQRLRLRLAAAPSDSAGSRSISTAGHTPFISGQFNSAARRHQGARGCGKPATVCVANVCDRHVGLDGNRRQAGFGQRTRWSCSSHGCALTTQSRSSHSANMRRRRAGARSGREPIHGSIYDAIATRSKSTGSTNAQAGLELGYDVATHGAPRRCQRPGGAGVGRRRQRWSDRCWLDGEPHRRRGGAGRRPGDRGRGHGRLQRLVARAAGRSRQRLLHLRQRPRRG